MKAINFEAKQVIKQLIAFLKENDLGDNSAILNNSNGAFMEVHISRRPDAENRDIINYFRVRNILPAVYSLAHYYELNGDLMNDPMMEFLEGVDGEFYPISFRQDSIGYDKQVLVFDAQGKCNYYYNEQAGQAEFANEWLRNIKLQQNL